MSYNNTDSYLSIDFEEKIRLTNLLIAIIGSVIFSVIFFFYLCHIHVKSIETSTKVIVVLLSGFHICLLAENIYRFAADIEVVDSEL